MSNTIYNGQSVLVNIQIGERLSVVSVFGNYTISIVAGPGTGTNLVTGAVGGTYGPYSFVRTVRILSSEISEIDYSVGSIPEILSDSVANIFVNNDVGGTAGIVAPEGGMIVLSSRPTLFVAGDSIITNTDVPRSSFFATTAKGSYVDSGSVKQRGITNVYAENPCRVKFRAAHLLNTGDYVWLSSMPSGHPLAHKSYTVTVTSADELTLNGVDATGLAPVTSGSVAADPLLSVDMSNANSGILTWINFYLRQPWASIQYRPVPGRTSAQIAANLLDDLDGKNYTHGILHAGRNDTSFDQTSLDYIRTEMLKRCGVLVVSLPYPDGNWATPANDADAAKIAAISAYWYAQQQRNPRIKIVDTYGIFSDPSKALQASRSNYLAADNVHPNTSGAMVGGTGYLDVLSNVTPVNTVSKSRTYSANALLNGRCGGVAGTVGSGVTGVVADSFTVGNRSANVAGGFVYTVKTPGRQRVSSAAYVVGDTFSTITTPGFLWLCKTAGTTAASEPAGIATGVLWDFATGVTDGTAVFVKIPDFTGGRKDNESWQLIEFAASTGTNENLSFYQEIALPTTQSIAVGDYVEAECDIVLYGQAIYSTLQLTCMDVGSVQLARAHDLSATSIAVEWPIDPLAGKCKTPVIRIPTGCTKIESRFRVGFPSTVKVRAFVSNMVVRKI